MKTHPSPRLSRKAGMPPESLVYTGTKTFATQIDLIRYDNETYSVTEDVSVQKAIKSIGDSTCNWLVISGFGDIPGLELLGEHFGINPLILEDILNVQHMPKVEDTGSSLFITLKSLVFSKPGQSIETEQISMFLGPNILITFQEQPSDLFEPIKDRLKSGKGKGRQKQEDYLAYLLIDHIVDNYYLLLDYCEDQIEIMEKDLLSSPSDNLAFDFLNFKKSLVVMRRTIYPLKDEIRYISREESEIINESTRQYLSDIHDHLNHIIQSLDNYRETISSMMDLLLANNSNRMNSIMKTLTLVSTIFIPLTFLVGVYGMNFKFMPELEWRFGYFALVGIMAVIGFGMYFYMKRKKWF
ncbi:MAG: magnesium/cobalt transporter CorA [Bacteroidetes bacterium]|nr:magnesium/cobalt transporter CorA [Bacteroidota bacterium]